MRTGSLIWAGALAVWSTAAIAADPKIDPFVSREISPRVHLLSTPQDYYGPVVGNVSVIEQGDGVVLVDSGLTAANGRAVADFVRSRTTKPVKAVIITHWHNDHPQGVSAIRDAWPKVRIIATAATKAGMLGPELVQVGLEPSERNDAEMAKQGVEYQKGLDAIAADPATAPDRRERVMKAKKDFAAFVEGYRGTYVVPPTEIFELELLLDDPDYPVRVLHLGRANTAGDALAWLPRQKIVMTGDIVVAPIPFGFFSYPADWIETIGKVKALGFTTLVPGHGEPQTDTRYIDQLTALISDVRAQVAPLAKQGLSLDEVRKRVDFSKHVDLFATQPRLKPQFQGFWVDPMTENAWKEAKGIAIVQGEGEVQANPAAKKSK